MKITVEAFECTKCGYVWIPVVANPKKCPKCQSQKWDEEKDGGNDWRSGRKARQTNNC